MARHEKPLSYPVDADGRLSAQLRQTRKAAGFTLSKAAHLAGWSTNHLSQVENGRQTPSELLVLDLDVLYDANGLLVSLYEEVLAERRQRALIGALKARGRALPLMPEASEVDRWTPERDAPLPIAGDEAAFEGDVSVPSGCLVERGSYFTKVWRIKNAGRVEWKDRFLKRVGPNAASTLVQTSRAVEIPTTMPGETVEVSVACRAQWIPSTSVAHFKMTFADGRLCWPSNYSHGLDLLVTAVDGESCGCDSCGSIDTLALHRSASSHERRMWMREQTFSRPIG